MGSLVMRARRRQPGAGRRRAGGRPRGLCRRGHRGRSRRTRSSRSSREEVEGLPPEEWGRVHRRHRPADRPRRWRRRIAALTGERIARLLRRHRADRPSRLASTWTWPGSSRATTRPGPAAPAPTTSTARWTGTQYDRLRRRARGGREDRVQAMGGHALFRRLPADRGHGRARPRDPAPRPDEARGPDQSARPDRQGLRDRPAAPGQCAGHALQHGRLPDEAEARRAGARLPHHPRPRTRRIRPPRRPAPQHLPQLAELLDAPSAAEGASRACASPARSPAARAMSKAPPSA